MAILKAVIFDFDGVLAHTEPLHCRSFQRVLVEEGIMLSQEAYYSRYVGLTDAACFAAVYADSERAVARETIERLIARKSQLMKDAIRNEVAIDPDVLRFVREASTRYRLAVASGALQEEIELCLGLGGLRQLFEHVTAAQDVQNGKPYPDAYLHALGYLRAKVAIQASECLVIEDTVHGIEAAHTAGMRCLAVATTLPPSSLHAADAVVPSLGECELEAIAARFWD